MRKSLNIYYEKSLLGTLIKKEDDALFFQYTKDWLADQSRFPLSPALPLQEEAFNHRLTRAYFDNLLPEGEMLKIFEKTLMRSLGDPYSFLENYGLDCAGALQITPSQKAPPWNSIGDLKKITYDEIDSIIEKDQNLFVHGLNAHKGRFSLAGAQDKIPVIFEDNEIYIPTDSTPTTHILKPPVRLPSAFESVHNEFVCMRLAQLTGLPVPIVHVVGKRNPLFLVERYDRERTHQVFRRIHQFDLCQAQGYPATEKYEEDGGPSFAQNYKFIKAISDDKIHDLDTSLSWLAFNLLIGNNDSHSKNLSFIFKKSETRTAPLYDLLSTSIYKDLAPEFAFKIGGQRLWYRLKRKNFEMLAEDLGFVKRKEIVIDKVLEMARKIEKSSEILFSQAEKDHPNIKIPAVLHSEITKRIRFFREKLEIKK
jgi:serine/threonine-protein kinase HipA